MSSNNPSSSSPGGSFHQNDIWREKCDRLEKENRILRATNKHLRTLLSNATAEVDSLKVLVSELEESCHQATGLIANLRSLKIVKEEDVRSQGPLSLLPQEVWELILEKLEDSRDIQNFCRAYPPWEQLLERSKPTFLFDQVFLCLFPFIHREDTFTLRLVCKRWSRTITHFLENNPVRRPPPVPFSGPVLRLRTLSTWLSSNGFNANDITPLKSHLFSADARSHPGNPLLGRAATFKFEPDCPHHAPFLTQFGCHIWFLRIESRQNGASWLFWKLVEILPLVPNLKKLDLAVSPVGAPSGVVPAYLTVLEAQWKQNHLPPLPHLESLEVSEHDLFHGYILKNVLISHYGAQIRRLGINQYAINPGSGIERLGNLTELTLRADTDGQMESLLRLRSPVTRLTLYMTYNDHDPSQDYPNVQLVLRAVHAFRRSLRSLYIQFPGPHSSVQWASLYRTLVPLQLPYLTTLGLRESTPLSFNLIAGLASSLEYLHLYSYRIREGVSPLEYLGVVAHSEILDIHQCLQNPKGSLARGGEGERGNGILESNMWLLLPKLKQFTVAVDNSEVERSYRRESWEKVGKARLTT